MEKETIGKIQLTIGIILLISGIGGLIYLILIGSSSIYIELWDNGAVNDLLKKEIGTYENATQDIKVMSLYNIKNMNALNIAYQREKNRELASTSALMIIISLLFITQGLANKSGNPNK